MELMAVVGIIVVMASMVVGGFSGIQRAMGASTGAGGLRRALNAARQQACIDGTDVYVWCIDVDKFVICRNGGVISDATAAMNSGGKRKLPYMAENPKENVYWICDDYADFGNTIKSTYINADDIGESNNDSKEITSELLDKYKETYIFDLTGKQMARYLYPADLYTSEDYQGWMFGIPADEQDGAFTAGHEYAWILMPVQTLPGGYVFDDSYNANDGKFKESWGENAYVHFFPDGRAECGLGSRGFTIQEVGVATPYSQRVAVSADGLVSVH
jgi:type II secretory pathway pseudopilin PulG